MKILDYRVTASMNPAQGKITGTASVWLQPMQDSVKRYSFQLPINITAEAIRDIDGDKYDHKRLELQNSLNEYTIELPSHLTRKDSFFVQIEFEGIFDTASTSPQFVNEREFILQYTAQHAWLPVFKSSSILSAELQITIPDSFAVIAAAQADSSAVSDGKRTLTVLYLFPAQLQDVFSLCGSKEIVEKKRFTTDSLFAISLYTSPTRFHQTFADTLVAQMIDAASYFAKLMHKEGQHGWMKYAVLGDNFVDNPPLLFRDCLLKRNSPAYAHVDSSIFTQSISNDWLFELARKFCPSTTDSSAVFHDGLANYLVSRYLMSISHNPLNEHRERLDLMIHALSFFPASPLGAGKTAQTNMTGALAFKGRYIFLMLEHILGRESFDTVLAKMNEQYSATPITVQNFQSLCEKEYGSPLDWFFQEWMYRSTAPEFVLHWKNEQTQRGMNNTTVTIEQRGDLFSMPLPIRFTLGSRVIFKRIFADKAFQNFTFTFPSPPTTVELDPQYTVLRWILDIRILAHARSSIFYRVINHDLVSSEKEAELVLQLDPNNTTGTASMAYFSLAKIAVLKNDMEKGKELFLKAMQATLRSSATEEQTTASNETRLYQKLSFIRFANIMEMEGKRNEALMVYQRVIAEGQREPVVFARAIVEAEKYLRNNFISDEALWFGLY
ncbi:MAG: hypothetical protein PHP42_14005 [Bacteroidota bacterium]|nr:hypothetical protein [Bacteroidota bacterium]